MPIIGSIQCRLYIDPTGQALARESSEPLFSTGQCCSHPHPSFWVYLQILLLDVWLEVIAIWARSTHSLGCIEQCCQQRIILSLAWPLQCPIRHVFRQSHIYCESDEASASKSLHFYRTIPRPMEMPLERIHMVNYFVKSAEVKHFNWSS